MTRRFTAALLLTALGTLALPTRFPALAAPPLKPTGATIVVAVSGVNNRDGLLRVNLYAHPDGFPADPDKAYQHRYILLQSLPATMPLDPMRVTFENLPPGTYAVCSIHDSNGNNKLDSNFLGIPREDWAVSNDARPRFRSPHFSEAQFTLGAGETKAIAFRVRH